MSQERMYLSSRVAQGAPMGLGSISDDSLSISPTPRLFRAVSASSLPRPPTPINDKAQVTFLPVPSSVQVLHVVLSLSDLSPFHRRGNRQAPCCEGVCAGARAPRPARRAFSAFAWPPHLESCSATGSACRPQAPLPTIRKPLHLFFASFSSTRAPAANLSSHG